MDVEEGGRELVEDEIDAVVVAERSLVMILVSLHPSLVFSRTKISDQ